MAAPPCRQSREEQPGWDSSRSAPSGAQPWGAGHSSSPPLPGHAFQKELPRLTQGMARESTESSGRLSQAPLESWRRLPGTRLRPQASERAAAGGQDAARLRSGGDRSFLGGHFQSAHDGEDFVFLNRDPQTWAAAQTAAQKTTGLETFRIWRPPGNADPGLACSFSPTRAYCLCLNTPPPLTALNTNNHGQGGDPAFPTPHPTLGPPATALLLCQPPSVTPSRLPRASSYCALSLSPSPCRNGATCQESPQGPRCLCPPGYTGGSCQTPLDLCAQKPCPHAARCLQTGPSFQCQCLQGWTGPLCDLPLSSCQKAALSQGVEVSALCQNGGLCVDSGPSYFCHCPPGFQGSSCQDTVNPCESRPCHHGATCVAQPHGYLCQVRV
ncbi:uncharacterized protein LOC142871026 [Microcebus murinus]|uniref:uncharacterized protein LOC142871026 n=1 Tax=Microcebus murinus TaxID=30608 RepID=UPI003F6BB526